MPYPEEVRTRARRPYYLRDRAVFATLQPGSIVRVLWVSSSWDAYGGDPGAPHVRELLYEVVEGPTRESAGYTAEVRPVIETGRYGNKWAQLLIRGEEDAPRQPDGTIDYRRAGGVNTALLVFRQGGPGTALTTGGWVHLQPSPQIGQLALFPM